MCKKGTAAFRSASAAVAQPMGKKASAQMPNWSASGSIRCSIAAASTRARSALSELRPVTSCQIALGLSGFASAGQHASSKLVTRKVPGTAEACQEEPPQLGASLLCSCPAVQEPAVQ